MNNHFKKALSISFPVFLGYFPAGVAFGVLASNAGFPGWLIIFMSLLMYGASAQYAAIPLMVTGQSFLTLGVNTFAINLRHIFYALPLLTSMPKNKFKKAYCLFALTDECFSIMTTLPKEERESVYFPAATLLHMYWVGSTCVGVLLAGWVGEHVPNLEFAMPCLFMVLWYEQVKHNKIIWPTAMGVTFFILALLISPSHALILSLTLCVITILLKELFLQKKENV